MKEDIKMAKIDIQELKEQSFAKEILSDYKKGNKRMFIILLVVLSMWFITIGYLVYILNDIGSYEETRNQEVYDLESIENSDIINGDYNGKD